MIECEVTIYQPGTVTKYILIHGKVGKEDAEKLHCEEGDLFLAYDSHGAYTFTSNVTPGYVAEKLHIERYMLDAWAIAQFIRAKLGADLIETGEEGKDWSLCSMCGNPEYQQWKQGHGYGCYCKRRNL
jgi:hypothetical protein